MCSYKKKSFTLQSKFPFISLGERAIKSIKCDKRMLHAREFRKLTWQLCGSIRIQIQDPDFLSNPRSSFSNAERRPHDLSPVNSLIASFINPLVQSSINKMCLKHRLYVYFYIKDILLSIRFKIFASSSYLYIYPLSRLNYLKYIIIIFILRTTYL